jgi:voltage-gated potassium channel
LAVAELHWWVLAAAAAGHASLSWLILTLDGESKIVGPVDFLYWYATTAYTVGYGDLSPQTSAGRLATAIFVFPGAIAIFTTIVAKSLTAMGDFWRRRREGRGDYRRMTETTVVIGFIPDQTPKMIDELHAEGGGKRVVLFTRKELAEPDARILYIRARALTDPNELRRAGVHNARRVAIYTDNDPDTLAAALAVSGINETAHVVCYFQDHHAANLLKLHCPQVEAIIAPGPEMVVRAVQDPGASRVLSALISHLDDSATLYCAEWHSDRAATIDEAAKRLHEKDATLLAWQAAGDEQPSFDVRSRADLPAGARLFYVAQRRLADPVGA